MKFILLFAIGYVLWRLFGPNRKKAVKPKPAAGEPVQMVQCAHCGLHLASGEAVEAGPLHFCSDAHRSLGVGKP